MHHTPRRTAPLTRSTTLLTLSALLITAHARGETTGGAEGEITEPAKGEGEGQAQAQAQAQAQPQAQAQAQAQAQPHAQPQPQPQREGGSGGAVRSAPARVAVMTLRNDTSLRPQEVRALTEVVYQAVVESLGADFAVVTPDERASARWERSCSAQEERCGGRALGVDFIVAGALSQLGRASRVVVRVYGAHDARLLGVRAESALDLEGVTSQVWRAAVGAAWLIDPTQESQEDSLSRKLDALRGEREGEALVAELARLEAAADALLMRKASRVAPAPIEPAPVAPAPVAPAPVAAEIEWVAVPGGSFLMGASDGNSDEQPVRQVRVRPFLLSKTEVTVGQYRRCLEARVCTAPAEGGYRGACNWGRAGREAHPVNCVDWAQARTFARWVGADLPTEAEWEYAARLGEGAGEGEGAGGGARTQEALAEVSWHRRNSGRATQPVGARLPDSLGLFDLRGNVWEWTLDEYKSRYRGAPRHGHVPVGGVPRCGGRCPNSGVRRVSRGGSWNSEPLSLSLTFRDSSYPTYQSSTLGFRVRKYSEAQSKIR
jgi:formylglycine-generating enzyme required for sulfatase activity